MVVFAVRSSSGLNTVMGCISNSDCICFVSAQLILVPILTPSIQVPGFVDSKVFIVLMFSRNELQFQSGLKFSFIW
jgi:hypothetical protein